MVGGRLGVPSCPAEAPGDLSFKPCEPTSLTFLEEEQHFGTSHGCGLRNLLARRRGHHVPCPAVSSGLLWHGTFWAALHSCTYLFIHSFIHSVIH